MPGLHLHVAASPAATWLALFSRGSLSCFPRAGEMGAKEGGTEQGRDSDHYAGSISERESATYTRVQQTSAMDLPLLPQWLFAFYTNGLWGEKFSPQFCQTCSFLCDLLFSLCGNTGTMPHFDPCLDSSFACPGTEAQVFASPLFPLNP